MAIQLDCYESTRPFTASIQEGQEPPHWDPDDQQRNLDCTQGLKRRGWRLVPGLGWQGASD